MEFMLEYCLLVPATSTIESGLASCNAATIDHASPRGWRMFGARKENPEKAVHQWVLISTKGKDPSPSSWFGLRKAPQEKGERKNETNLRKNADRQGDGIHNKHGRTRQC